MTQPVNEHVTCPACGKAYRWKPTLVGQLVPCKKCNTEFTVPKQPGKGLPVVHQADNDDSVYALAMDIDEMPTPAPPPPRERPAAPKPFVPTDPATPTSTPTSPVAEPSEPDAPREVSEAVKAQRREEQRLAAAATTTKSWRDYKLPIFLAVGITLVVIILLVLIFVSDALDGFLG